MSENFDVKLSDQVWMKRDYYRITPCFQNLGYERVSELLPIRVFDFLNLNGINNNRAQEMIFLLYEHCNGNCALDEKLYYGEAEQDFDFRSWNKQNKDLSKVLVRDIVLSAGMNEYALKRIFTRISKAFYKSDEYNSREYRWCDKYELDSFYNKYGIKEGAC